jgi:hypothetical protein
LTKLAMALVVVDLHCPKRELMRADFPMPVLLVVVHYCPMPVLLAVVNCCPMPVLLVVVHYCPTPVMAQAGYPSPWVPSWNQCLPMVLVKGLCFPIPMTIGFPILMMVDFPILMTVDFPILMTADFPILMTAGSCPKG